MDGQASLWDAAAEFLGDAPRVEILALLHATGSDGALKWRKVRVCGLLSGMGTGVIRWLQHLAEQSELPGAQALLNLRCVALNDEWEPFMNHYIQRETARLSANIPITPQPAHLRLVA